MDQGAVVLDEVGPAGDDVERGVVLFGKAMVTAECFAALTVAEGTFEISVDDGPVLHGAVAIFPGQGDV